WWWQQTPVWDIALKGVFYFPVVVLLAALVGWAPGLIRRARRRAGTTTDGQRLVLLAWAGGVLLAFNRPRDSAHLMMIYPPALVLGTALMAGVVERLSRFNRRMVAAALIGALAVLCAATVGVAREMRHAFSWPLASPRAGVLVDPHNGPVVDDVVAWIARTARPGAPVPAWPTQPIINFLADRETAGGFLLIWPFQEADRDARIIADLEHRDVDTVIYSLSQIGMLRSMPENAPELFAYLVDHFEIDAVFVREPQGTMMLGLRRRGKSEEADVVVPDGAGFARVLWPFERVLAPSLGTGASKTAQLSLRVPAERPVLTFR